MRVEDLRQIHDSYDHLYLSPHFDDAALSCGGAITTHQAGGARVLVVTLCTAAPPPEGPFNAVAREFHADWGLEAADVNAVRQREELLAMERLGCDFFWAGMLDAIYRVPDAYVSRETLFAAPDPHDPLHHELRRLLAALRARAPRATFYAPLGVGDHVDHLVTYAAALDTAGPGLAFYEDVHYVLQPGALERRLSAIRERLTPALIDIDATLEHKIHAIRAYQSQVPELFGGDAEMAAAITTYARSVVATGDRHFERIWKLQTM
jgi:LmbE family N-acetylglucosaminyl deacetylase